MLRINSWAELKMLNAKEVGTLERSIYGNCFICLVGLDGNYLSIQMRLTECPKDKEDFVRLKKKIPYLGTILMLEHKRRDSLTISLGHLFASAL